MLSSVDRPGGWSDVITHSDHPQPPRRLSMASGDLPGIDLRSLPTSTTVVVNTLYSRYRFTLLDDGGCDALVQGGHHFPQETEVHIAGATLGGSRIKIGWIGVGLFLELSVGKKRILTSRVRSIAVEPVA
jgi:hypothetical protein